MKPASFEYHAPERPDEAVALLADLGEDAKLLAGGQSLVPMLALRLAVFEHLVDISRIAELQTIQRTNGSVHIGAGATQTAVETNADVVADVPLLARATPLIAHFQIRNRGTLGGSMAHADPAAEYPAVALALDASMEVLSRRGTRAIPAGDFFTGLWTTALGDDELLTRVTFPVWTGRCGFAIEEFAHRHGDFALAGVALALALDAAERVERCNIALFGLGSTTERATAAATELIGADARAVDAEELGRRAVSDLHSIPSDLHGSAEYRRRVGGVMVARAWRAAREEAMNA